MDTGSVRAVLVAAAVALCGCPGGGGNGGGPGGAVYDGLSLTPASVGLEAARYGTVPPTGWVDLEVTHPDAAGILVGYPPGTATPSWLALDMLGTGPDYSLGLSITSTTLPLGTYTAIVRVVVVRADASVAVQADVPVTYVVRDGVMITPASIYRRYVLGGSASPASGTLSLTGASGMAWTASDDQPWIGLGTSSGTLPGSTSVAVNPSGLALGTYGGTVSVTGAGVTSTGRVTLVVAPAAFTTSPESVPLAGASGHDFKPRALSFNLDTGTNAYAWSASASDPWVVITPTSGTVSATSASIAVTASDAARSFAAGTYTSSITLTSVVAGHAVTTEVPVTMTLDDRKLLVGERGVALTTSPGLGSLSRSVEVRANRGTATWTAQDDRDWLTVTASGATGDPIVLTADPAGLATDALYEATVTVTPGDADIANVETIRVGLRVLGATPEPSTLVAATATELATDPVRPWAYAHAAGTDVTIYDVHTGVVAGTIAGAGAKLGAMAVSDDGSRLFVVDDGAPPRVVPIELATLTAGTPWSMAAGTLNGQRIAYARANGVGLVLAGDGHVYDAASGAPFSATFSIDDGATLAASRGGSRFCWVNHHAAPYSARCFPLDHSSLGGQAIVGTGRTFWGGSTANDGMDIALSNDGERIYLAVSTSSNSFIVLDPYGLATGPTGPYWPVLQSLTGDPYPRAVEVGADDRLFCGSSQTASLRIYDGAGSPLSTVTLGTAPQQRGLAVSGDQRRLVVRGATSLLFETVAP